MDILTILFIIVACGVIVAVRVIQLIAAARRTWRVLTRQIDTSIPQVEGMLRQYHSSAMHTPQEQTAITAALLQMHTQMRQLDGMHRQQYEGRINELTSMAAREGISFTPPSW